MAHVAGRGQESAGTGTRGAGGVFPAGITWRVCFARLFVANVGSVVE